MTSIGRVASILSKPSVRAGLVMGLAFALFVGSGSRGATLTGDPIRYAQTSREIVERGDPTRLTLDGALVARKPPLVFWMVALAYGALGFTDVAARLPSQAMGLATVALLMFLVSRRNGRRAAFWAGLSCATWYVFRDSASTCRLESTLAFLSLASLGAFLRIDRLGPSPLRALGLGALLGLAVLAKGPPGVLPAAAIALGALVTGRGRLLLRTAPLAALGLVLVAGPWYATQIVREGPAWWDQLHADWTRDTAPVHDLLAALPLYGSQVFAVAAVWVPSLAMGVTLAIRRVRRTPRRALPEALLLSFVASLLVTLPFLKMHYVRYFAQVVPAFAWLVATWTAPALRRLSHRGVFARLPTPHRLASVALAVLVVVGYPVVVLAGLSPPLDRWGDLRSATRAFAAVAPGAPVLPTTSARELAARKDDISIAVSAASRFYFETPLVPYDPSDAARPPFVLFRHQATGPGEASEFEARHPSDIVWRGREYTLFRVR